MQDAYAVKAWATLDDVLTTILGGQKAQGSLEALYRAIEKICLVGRAREIYDKRMVRLDVHFTQQLASAAPSRQSPPSFPATSSPAPWPPGLAGANNRYGPTPDREGRGTAADIWCACRFLYLNCSYLYGVRGRGYLEPTAVRLFRKHTIEGPVLRSRVHDDFLRLFAVERAGPAATDTDEFELLRSPAWPSIWLYTTRLSSPA